MHDPYLERVLIERSYLQRLDFKAWPWIIGAAVVLVGSIAWVRMLLDGP